MRRCLTLCLAALLLWSGCLAETPTLMEDPENGRWEYHSDALTIVIDQASEKVKVGSATKTREYCVAEIWASPESPLYPVMTEPTKKRPAGYKLVSPELLQEKAHPLFAMSDDMYGIRLQKYDYKGVVIRDGEILATKTRNSAKKRAWPNLDTMALYPDGSMKTYVCDAYTAEEYLAMGAQQVFSFGPILISEGEINPEVLNPKYYPYNEPRVALGMVEPWHYVALVVRGRPKGSYAGVHLDWMAQLLQEKGCVEALNLDGGQTATLMFNGKIIETGDKGLRSQGSMICFGKIGE
ncbi:MAG: phosphodiester glycosidase family protein [Clostridia bacterium]|nr:phosphodiester glycosidase family protein [Clostridia bacterium]